jgi:hypothetical protein
MSEEPGLFRGSRFIFWTLGPCLLLFAVTIFLLLPREKWLSTKGFVSWALIVAALLLFLKLYDGIRFHWAGRVVAGMVFAAYVAYFVHELVVSPAPFRMPRSRSEASAVNALLGLLIFGIPGLLYALLGRVTFRHEGNEEEDAELPE